jgi:hypothetical protein
MEKEVSDILIAEFVRSSVVGKMIWNAAIEAAAKKAHNYATLTIAAAEIRKAKK